LRKLQLRAKKESFDNVLTKNGMHPPAGKTPMQGWDLACRQKLP